MNTNFKLYEMASNGFNEILERQNAMNGGEFSPDMFVSRKDFEIKEGIAFIDVYGILKAKTSEMEEAMGYTSYEDIEEELEQARLNNVSAVVLSFNSSGGEAIGCQEVADMIANFPIPTFAVIKSAVCFSAAYKLASACSQVLATVSSEVGSIGSVVMITTNKGAMNAAGVQMQIFTNDGATLKGMGADFGSLTEDQKAFIQDKVNDQGLKFQNTVKRNRPEINEVAFNAGIYPADKALELGLIDAVI